MKKSISLILFLVLLTNFCFSQTVTGDKFSRFNVGTNSLVDEKLFPFFHGVASGDPLKDRVIIWTRVSPEDVTEGVTVTWRMATDTLLQNVVKSGTFITTADRDFTVKVDVTGLQPEKTYYYGFTALGKNSITGRTRTAPEIMTNQLRFGLVSCSNMPNGFFNSYQQLSKIKDLDAVIHLGDYIYEYASSTTGDRAVLPAGETITLSDYRLRHGSYKLDPDLRAVHQQNPFIVVWDDHESTNNSYREGAENHTEGAEGIWDERKRFSARAYDEWMPIRTVDTANTLKIFRVINYGGLADIIMLDTRIYDRDEQLSNAVVPGMDLNDPNRRLIGPEQMQFLLDALKNSTSKWKVIGQQVMFMHWNIVGKPLLDIVPLVPDIINLAVNESGVAFNSDAWDGYPAERKTILEFIRDENIDNVIILTGDIHSHWAADVAIDPFNPLAYNPLTGEGSLAVEFVTISVTSSNLNAVSTDPLTRTAVHTGITTANPHIKYVNLFDNGFSILDLKTNKAQTDYFLTPVTQRTETISRERSYSTSDGANRVVRETNAATPKTQQPDLAPKDPPVDVVTSVKSRVSKLLVTGSYPNPATDKVFMQIVLNNKPSALTIQISDVQGKLIKTLTDKKLEGGLNEIILPVDELENGVYLVKLITSTEVNTHKIIIQK